MSPIPRVFRVVSVKYALAFNVQVGSSIYIKSENVKVNIESAKIEFCSIFFLEPKRKFDQVDVVEEEGFSLLIDEFNLPPTMKAENIPVRITPMLLINVVRKREKLVVMGVGRTSPKPTFERVVKRK